MSDIYDTAIYLDGLSGFTPTIRPLADGLRASLACECPSCAIIQYLNPTDDRVASDVVSEGVATLGHLLHQAWAFQSFEGHGAYEVEAAIPWAHGVSHDDVIVHEGPYAGVYEVKTHSDTKPKAPSAANRRQSEFRLRLRERAGLPVPGPMRIVMIGKAGREGGMVRGPWDVPLTDERRAEIDATLATIDAFLAAPPYDLHGDSLRAMSDGCPRCFPKPVRQPVRGLDGLLGRYVAVKRERDEIEQQRRDRLEARKALDSELAQLQSDIDALVPAGVVMEGMAASVTRTRAGVLQIRDLTEAGAA